MHHPMPKALHTFFWHPTIPLQEFDKRCLSLGPLCQGRGLNLPKWKPKKRNVVLDSCERSFTSQSRIQQQQQRFHFIDVHASWKCSYYYYYYYHWSFPWLCFFRAAQVCVNELRSCLRESCCKTKTSMHSECKVQLYCMKTHYYNNHKAEKGTEMEQHISLISWST